MQEYPTSELVYTFRDIEDTSSRVQIHFPNNTGILGFGGLSALDELEVWAVGNFVGWAQGVGFLAVQGVSDCEIFRAAISQSWYNDDIVTPGSGESEQWGVYQFADDNQNYFEISIPDPPEAILQPNLRYIDPANGDVVAFADEILLDLVVDTKAEVVNAQNLKAARFVEGWKRHDASNVEGYRATG